ncbi:MAG: transcription termination factor Rho [Planctomycetia bacterium]|nr:transcription termination factor Rho [Planctomycetia bacterium]
MNFQHQGGGGQGGGHGGGHGGGGGRGGGGRHRGRRGGRRWRNRRNRQGGPNQGPGAAVLNAPSQDPYAGQPIPGDIPLAPPALGPDGAPIPGAPPAQPIQPIGRGEGVLEIHPEGFGFLRDPKNNYLSTPQDIYVAKSQIVRFSIREGSWLEGPLVPSKDRSKGPALMAVERINGMEPEKHRELPVFKQMTSIDPCKRIDLEGKMTDISLRVMDLICPIGKGQRCLIVAPPRTGKTILLQRLAQVIAMNHPECHIIMLLVDERPEEVTDMQRNVKGEVVSSSLDKQATAHARLSELVLERARRLVESGKDVVILLDSLTRLARAYNRESGGHRTMSGGLDSRAMEKPREFFGSARALEEGGSLTIIATCLVDTGSRMDQVIFEDFKGTGNAELVLHRPLAERRIFPAIDINASGTRKEEKLRVPVELERVYRMRRALAQFKPIEAMEALIPRVQKWPSNSAFLAQFDVSNER